MIRDAEDTIRERMSLAVSQGKLPHAMLLIGDSICCSELTVFAASKLFGCSEERVRFSPDYYTYTGERLRVTMPTSSTAKNDIVVVTDILDTVATMPFGSCRVIHINHAGKMSEDVQNKLLKTLEEPPKGNYFILHDFVEGLLPTVRSRCVTQNIGLLSPSEAAKHVKTLARTAGQELSEADALYYCSMADSSVEQAQNLISNTEYLKLYMRCVDYVCDLGVRSLVDQRLDEFAKTQDEARCLVMVLDLCLNDMLRDTLSLPHRSFTRPPQSDRLKKNALRLGAPMLLRLCDNARKANERLNADLPARAALFELITSIEQSIG